MLRRTKPQYVLQIEPGSLPTPYQRTPDDYEVDGNRMDAPVWKYGAYFIGSGAAPHQTETDFYANFPGSLIFSNQGREDLIWTYREFIKIQRQELCTGWKSINQLKVRFRILWKFMSSRKIVQINHITPQDVVDLLAIVSVSQRKRVRLMLKQLYAFRHFGLIPDGLSFDPDGCGDVSDGREDAHSEDASGDAEKQKEANEVMSAVISDRTEPFDRHTFATILASAVLFVRVLRPELVKILKAYERSGVIDVGHLKDHPMMANIKRVRLQRLLYSFQRACFIMIASTLIGRTIEYTEMPRLKRCYYESEIDGLVVHNFEMLWSKEPGGERVLVTGKGTKLTLEAVQALDEIVEAHPDTRNSEFLFCSFSRQKRSGRVVGSAINSKGMYHALQAFVRDFAGFSADAAREVAPHRFRSTAIINLCHAKHGVVAAFIESRHSDLAETSRYALAHSNWLGINENLDALAA
jgi:hypothetical protein